MVLKVKLEMVIPLALPFLTGFEDAQRIEVPLRIGQLGRASRVIEWPALLAVFVEFDPLVGAEDKMQ